MITKYKQQILALSPLNSECVCKYDSWHKQFGENQSTINHHIKIIEKQLGERFTRKDIISFHRCDNIDDITKFLSVMMWGYSSDGIGRPDNRGPSRVQEMTKDIAKLSKILTQTKELIREGHLKEAYKCFHPTKVPKCGPSFFSKYFYFVGRSLKVDNYPLIFDNRVASGLVNISVLSSSLLEFVSVQTITRADTYVKYVNLLHDWAKSLECEADQIEFFLFQFGR